jgi:acyl-CoA thioester hydrolase
MQVYAYWETVGTRWKDNDIYGHINNAVYYSLMDTVINNWLIRHAGLDIHSGDTIGLCVESHCVFKAPATFPEPIRVGLRVGHLGRSSVRYEVGLFRDDDSAAPLAEGHFVHVFVDRRTRRPAPIEGPMRQAMQSISEQ